MRASLFAPVVFALSLALAACDSAADQEATFGDPYTVLVTDDSPLVNGGRLAVSVEYDGCDETHEFVLRSRTAGDAAEVWWVHDARGDACDSLQTATVRAALPATVTDAAQVVLLTPDGQGLPLQTAAP